MHIEDWIKLGMIMGERDTEPSQKPEGDAGHEWDCMCESCIKRAKAKPASRAEAERELLEAAEEMLEAWSGIEGRKAPGKVHRLRAAVAKHREAK